MLRAFGADPQGPACLVVYSFVALWSAHTGVSLAAGHIPLPIAVLGVTVLACQPHDIAGIWVAPSLGGASNDRADRGQPVSDL